MLIVVLNSGFNAVKVKVDLNLHSLVDFDLHCLIQPNVTFEHLKGS